MKITVITVVYNNVETIERTIRSVLDQTYTDYEYLIVDGGSTDGTLDVIIKYQDRITKWISESDRGIFDAMNKGITIATGEVIAFLNSDDWYEVDALEYVYREFMQSNIDILFCRIFKEWKDDREDGAMAKVMVGKDLYRSKNLMHPAVFAKRVLFDKIGAYDLQYPLTADNDWFKKVIEMGGCYICSNKITTHYSMNGISGRNIEQLLIELQRRDLEHSVSNDHAQEIINYYKENIARHTFNCNPILKNDTRFTSGKLYLFGAGYYGRLCLKQLYEVGIIVKGILDNNKEKWGECLNGVTIYGVEEVELLDAIIFITVRGYDQEIKEQLMECGIDNNQIITWEHLIGNNRK